MTFLDISRFDVAEQYIQASRNLIDGMLETGNRLVAMSDHRLSEKELYEELRSNSQSIILPALFCLYQGVELLLKGFVIMKTQKNSGHNAEALFGDFATCYPEEGDLRALFEKFIYSPKDFISQYKQENGIKSNINFYNSLRYPDKRPKKIRMTETMTRAIISP